MIRLAHPLREAVPFSAADASFHKLNFSIAGDSLSWIVAREYPLAEVQILRRNGCRCRLAAVRPSVAT
jgi:hypothetical protein